MFFLVTPPERCRNRYICIENKVLTVNMRQFWLSSPELGSCTVRMKSLTMFSGALHLLYHYKSNLAHLLAF